MENARTASGWDAARSSYGFAVDQHAFAATGCRPATAHHQPILDSWMYYIDVAEKHVFIVTYGCYADDDKEPVLSHEHKEIGQFTEVKIPSLPMPDGYKRSIMEWFARLRADSTELVG